MNHNTTTYSSRKFCCGPMTDPGRQILQKKTITNKQLGRYFKYPKHARERRIMLNTLSRQCIQQQWICSASSCNRQLEFQSFPSQLVTHNIPVTSVHHQWQYNAVPQRYPQNVTTYRISLLHTFAVDSHSPTSVFTYCQKSSHYGISRSASVHKEGNLGA